MSFIMVNVDSLQITGSLSRAGPVLPELHLSLLSPEHLQRSTADDIVRVPARGKTAPQTNISPPKPAQTFSSNQSSLQSLPEHHKPLSLLSSLHPSISTGFLGARMEPTHPPSGSCPNARPSYCCSAPGLLWILGKGWSGDDSLRESQPKQCSFFVADGW